MFTGLIKETGTVVEIKNLGDALELTVRAEWTAKNSAPDDSIAVNGVCLTVTSLKENTFVATAVRETVSRTNLKALKKGSAVNIEPALKADDRLGGHIVQGHIDSSGEIIKVFENINGREFLIRTDGQSAKYLVRKGSVCLDGISLTVADIDVNVFKVAIIPHTLNKTTAGSWRSGAVLNIETDILGRYIEKLLKNGGSGISENKLKELGY